MAYQHAVTATFSYAKIGGDDALTNYPNRRLRNLHFRSDVYEIAARYEFHLIRPLVRHTLNIRKTLAFKLLGLKFSKVSLSPRITTP